MFMSDHLIDGFLCLIENQERLYRCEQTSCQLSLVPRKVQDHQAKRLRMTIPTVWAKRIGLWEGYYVGAGFDVRIMRHGFFALRCIGKDMADLAPKGSGFRRLKEFEDRGKFRPDLPFNMDFDPRYIEQEWDARIYLVSVGDEGSWYLVRFPIGFIVHPDPNSIYNRELGISKHEARVGEGKR